jgi:excisionase family DNA binding protein
MEKLLLRPIEAAEVLGFSRSRVYEMIAKSEIPSIKVGKSVRVVNSALRALVESKQNVQNGQKAKASE